MSNFKGITYCIQIVKHTLYGSIKYRTISIPPAASDDIGRPMDYLFVYHYVQPSLWLWSYLYAVSLSYKLKLFTNYFIRRSVVEHFSYLFTIIIYIIYLLSKMITKKGN